MKCIVGMSGGVDSSVTVALAKKEGYEVIGCTFKMYDSEQTENFIRDAKAVAKYLNIDHEVVDCRENFSKYVQNYFVNMYANGETPNPCVMCNEFVKFATLDFVRENHSADVFMTGHYAKLFHDGNKVELHQAEDLSKDQSYFLYRVDREKLARARFPLGNFHKTHTRELAKQFGLFVAEKSDSQDVCFIPDGDYKRYLQDKITIEQGKIVDESGKVLGDHHGIINYTVGQRKGLGLPGGPFFVNRLDAKNNRVVVANHAALISEIHLKSVKFINEEYLGQCEVKVRSSGNKLSAEIVKYNDEYRVKLSKAESGISPGQHCVFYLQDLVVGGGIIER